MTDEDGKITPADIEILDNEITVENSILDTTRGTSVQDPRVLQALEAVASGNVPGHAIRKRPGAGSEVRYISHTFATRTMNAAFRWLWDYEILEWHVDEADGSVATRCQMTIHIPLPDGSYHVRRITEIGSQEGYPKTDANGKQKTYPNGAPMFTMNTADRIASSASRGLVKCLLRAFNIGLELSEKEGDNAQMTNKDAWNALLRYGRNQGLARDQVIEALKKAKMNADDLVKDFGRAYRVVSQAAKRATQEEVPNL